MEEEYFHNVPIIMRVVTSSHQHFIKALRGKGGDETMLLICCPTIIFFYDRCINCIHNVLSTMPRSLQVLDFALWGEGYRIKTVSENFFLHKISATNQWFCVLREIA